MFSIRGAGTVVTGTLWAGAVTRGQELLVLPRGLRTRIRAVQVHDQAVDSADAGQRVAVNLRGVDVGELQRGDVLVAPEAGIEPTTGWTVTLRWQATGRSGTVSASRSITAPARRPPAWPRSAIASGSSAWRPR